MFIIENLHNIYCFVDGKLDCNVLLTTSIFRWSIHRCIIYNILFTYVSSIENVLDLYYLTAWKYSSVQNKSVSRIRVPISYIGESSIGS